MARSMQLQRKLAGDFLQVSRLRLGIGVDRLKTTFHTPTTPGTAYAVYKQVK
jgi:hypothetical protein